MKKLFSPILALVGSLLVGCDRSENTGEQSQVFMFSTFEMEDPAHTPTTAELVALKAFTSDIYNPSNNPVAVDDSELEAMGFNTLITGTKSVFSVGKNEIVHQPIPWPEPSKRLQILRVTTPNKTSIYAETDISKPVVSVSDGNLVGSAGIGTYLFEDGLIIAWATKKSAE
jgi:hypothetical protein